jgi:hypothetical protein
VIINNAAQTIRRPPAYYRHLMPIELTPRLELPAEQRAILRDDPHAGEHVPQYVKLCLSPGVSDLGGDVAPPLTEDDTPAAATNDAHAAAAASAPPVVTTGCVAAAQMKSPLPTKPVAAMEVLHMEEGENGPTLLSLTPQEKTSDANQAAKDPAAADETVEHVSAGRCSPVVVVVCLLCVCSV